MGAVEDEIREYWNIDAATYDTAAGHQPRTAVELAAWASTLVRLLPSAPARVLDVGAGTGFLSLLLARHGYRVTSLDLAPAMLEKLAAKADRLGLHVETVEGSAEAPPLGEFDAVVERHVVWTLPDPKRALEAWRRAAPGGRLVLIESIWGSACSPAERLRARARALLAKMRNADPDHHGEYAPELRAGLPFGGGTRPDDLVALVESGSWGPARVERLTDVEWASAQAMASSLDRVIGLPPRFAVVAGR